MDPAIKDRIEKIRQGIVPEGYKKTNLGTLPKNWHVKMLGDIADVYGGEMVARNKLGEEGYSYLHYGDLHNLRSNYIDISKDESEYPKYDKPLNSVKNGCLLSDGDVVFCDASEDYEGIGKHALIINTQDKPFIAGLHTFVAKFKDDTLVNDFKKYVFLNHNIRKEFMFYATGISVLGITLENIKKIPILIPSKFEQQKIADILSTWDRAIELKEELIKEKEEQKKGLMKLLFKQINNFSKVDKLIEESKDIENNPSVNKLLTVRLHLEGVFKRDLRGNETVGATTLYKRKAGQFIYGKQNFHNGALGIVPEELDGYSSSSDIPSFDFQLDKVNPQYFYYYWSSRDNYKRLEAFTTGTGSKRLNPKDFLNMKMKLPSLEQQNNIADFLSTIEREIELLTQELELLKEQKKGLMQLLLTGIIRVGEVEGIG